MTAHVDLNECLTIRAVSVVHVLPLLQKGVDFVTNRHVAGVPRCRQETPDTKPLSKLASGDQLVISTAGPRDKPTWWRKSTRTVPLTGGMIQSGTITDIDSRVGPANTNVPPTPPSRRCQRNVDSPTTGQIQYPRPHVHTRSGAFHLPRCLL